MKMRILVPLTVFVFVFVFLLVPIICNAIVVHEAKGKVHDDVNEIRPAEYAILLGTSPESRITHKKNVFFKYRIDAAFALYQAGKVKKILISGSSHSFKDVDETLCMRDSLVSRGVPDSVFILDGKGFRTQASIENAVNTFHIKDAVVVSQRFHNERSIFLANHLSDVRGQLSLQGYNATEPCNALSYITYAREYLARVKMFLDLL